MTSDKTYSLNHLVALRANSGVCAHSSVHLLYVHACPPLVKGVLVARVDGEA